MNQGEENFANYNIFEDGDYEQTLIGRIFKGRDMSSGQSIRILRVDKKDIKESEAMDYEIFKNMLIMLQHYNPEKPTPYITKVLSTRETDRYLYVAHEESEAVSMDAMRKKAQGRSVDEHMVFQVIYEVLKALEICKTFGMPHYGVYPGNIYVGDGAIRLGLPNFRRIPGKVAVGGVQYEYTSPDKPKTPKSDIWSVGILVVDLLKGIGNKGTVKINKSTKELIGMMVAKIPKKRLGIKKLKMHKLFSEFRPQSFTLTSEVDSKGLPKTKMQLFPIAPGKKDFILSVRVKHAEAVDRKQDFDELYTGYLDGTIMKNIVVDDYDVETSEVCKGA